MGTSAHLLVQGLYTHDLQSSQPRKLEHCCSPLMSLLAKLSRAACPEIPGGKPEKNSVQHSGHWVRTDKWLWVNLQQVDSSSPGIPKNLGLPLAEGMSEGRSKDLQTNDFDGQAQNLLDYPTEVRNLKPGSRN